MKKGRGKEDIVISDDNQKRTKTTEQEGRTKKRRQKESTKKRQKDDTEQRISKRISYGQG